jgi:G:T-mismatch repair DNA endonuclease (very short patch repair protein)
MGWGVMIIWECQTNPAKINRLAGRITRFLDKT